MGKLRKVESESEARRCLAAVKGSGLSLKEWARSRGMDGRSLHAWQMNLERASAKRAARGRSRLARTKSAARGDRSGRASRMQLVELVPTPAPAPSRYVVRVGTAAVEFGDGFDAECLRRIIEVIRSC